VSRSGGAGCCRTSPWEGAAAQGASIARRPARQRTSGLQPLLPGERRGHGQRGVCVCGEEPDREDWAAAVAVERARGPAGAARRGHATDQLGREVEVAGRGALGHRHGFRPAPRRVRGRTPEHATPVTQARWALGERPWRERRMRGRPPSARDSGGASSMGPRRSAAPRAAAPPARRPPAISSWGCAACGEGSRSGRCLCGPRRFANDD